MTNSLGYHLLFTNKHDLTSDFIVRELESRNLNYLRLNTEDIANVQTTQLFDGSSTKLRFSETGVKLSNVVSAYFRRPVLPDFKSFDLSDSSKAYCVDEWSYLLRSIYLELDQKWFNHPNKIILAEDKPKQLRLAKEIGFNVPQTIISNAHNDIAPLFEEGAVVAKPLRHALLNDDEKGSVIFTSTIDSIKEINSDELSLAPVIFQRKIVKEYDLRITVVGEEVFAVAIDSQSFPETETDWRHTSIERLDHTIVELDAELIQKCISIVKRLGLRYGAIDLVLDKAGTFWFLECNPNGQWAWVESRTGLLIASAIVDIMESM